MKRKIALLLSAAVFSAILFAGVGGWTGAPHTANATPRFTAMTATAGLLPAAHTYTLTSSKKVYVYTTNTGSKYHRKSCRYLRYSRHKVTLKSAKAQGYRACKVCKPPR